MRHHVAGRKLGRKTPHRLAMLANMASSLIKYDRIETTLPKAKELRSLAERLITLGKQQTLHARRRAVALIRDKGAVHKLFSEIAQRFTDRKGGYTRVLKLGARHGDAAPMAIIEYVTKGLGLGSSAPLAGRKKKGFKASKSSVKKAKPPRPEKKIQSKPKGQPTVKRTVAARKAPQGG